MARPQSGEILCIGTTPALSRTIILNRLAVGEVNRASHVYEYASGKPINAARVLRAIGRAPAFIGPLGGARGACIRADLARCGIIDQSIEAPAETRLCVTVIDQEAATATELIEEHAAIAPQAAEALLDRVASRLQTAAAVVMTGSVAPGVGEDFYARVVCLASAAGVPALVDSHGEALLLALRKRPAVVKINLAEARATLALATGRASLARSLQDMDPPRAAESLAQLGGLWAIVTDGPRGCWASDGGPAMHFPAPSVKVVSTIGSGDAFAAGVAVALGDNLDLEAGCHLGTALGAANVVTPHAGHIDPADVERLENFDVQ